MSLALSASLLLAQVGPFAGAGQPVGGAPISPLPPEDRQREALAARRATTTVRASAAGAPPESGRLSQCIAAIDTDPQTTRDSAQAWLAAATTGSERAAAGECLGSAQAALGRFDAARAALLAARDAAAPGDHPRRARLGAMAGNAAIAVGDAAAALVVLDLARVDAGADRALLGAIATDRARALVALKRDAEATEALASARAVDPANAEAWLLSATLSRRLDRLDDAQRQIEQAVLLQPADPEIGLEAGVIAILAGHDAAARKSWQSVIAVAPDSDTARTARSYLAQSDPVAASSAAAPIGR